ncbi:lytic transglycosylase domain-containing protein [Eubacteriales bacterium OttesenSCG-928-M02]|nr:lytic transglycosylase domain-containing protein [Eubacteriales bacterium OttesenSCG-928-M02]
MTELDMARERQRRRRPPMGPPPPPRRQGGNKKRLWLFVVLGLLLVALIVAGGLFYLNYRDKAQYVLHHEDLILKYAEEYNLDPYMVCGIIYTESRFQKEAVSGVGARGLMQIMPDTGGWIAQKLGDNNFSEEKLFDPATNIRYGCWYLNYLFSLYPGKPDVVFAAYNTGQGRISGWLKDPQYNDGNGNLINIPFPETKRYVEKVNHAWERYKEIYTLGKDD